MKTIGLLGGMSFESTQDYYRLINQMVNQQLGGLHSAKIVLYSVDFSEIEQLQRDNNWEKAGELLAQAAINIEKAGADFILLCTNTMHIVADTIQASISIPLIHIADATGEALIVHNIKKVGLLGTAFTMEKAFYKGRLSDHYGLDVITPDPDDRAIIHRIIFEELCLGRIIEPSRNQYLEIIERLSDQGAEAIILGCTEIGLLIKQEDTAIPLFDTTMIHAKKAVELALSASKSINYQ